MDHLNALPQVLVGFFIVWLVVTATSILVCVWRVSQMSGTVEHWYDDWLDFKLAETEPEDPEPPKPVDPLQAKRDRMAKARAARKPRRRRDEE